MTESMPVRGTILVAEDRPSMGEMLEEALKAEGYGVILAAHGAQAIKLMQESKVDLVLTDLKMPRKGGLEVLKAAAEEKPPIPVILMTAFATVEIAVEAMKLGACDVLPKPFDMKHLLHKIAQLLEGRRLASENMLLREESSSRLALPRIFGRSPAMAEAADRVRKVAAMKTTVLLTGESGTGKELFARAIHDLGPRRDRPFVAINCAAIPGTLLESEMFGHERGAFTGADRRRLGRFELASGGTLFLDEISEMDQGLQAKLLRVIQEGEIVRVGGGFSIAVDVRVIAATNRDLEEEVRLGRFREDLFYRLNVFPIRIPPLRERREDIAPLAEIFIERFGRELGCGSRILSASALAVLEAHEWKGNVRELQNAIERAMILCDGQAILPEHLALSGRPAAESALAAVPMDGTLEEASGYAVRLVEKDRIERALRSTGGNKTRAAEILSVSYKTLLTKIKDYGIG